MTCAGFINYSNSYDIQFNHSMLYCCAVQDNFLLLFAFRKTFLCNKVNQQLRLMVSLMTNDFEDSWVTFWANNSIWKIRYEKALKSLIAEKKTFIGLSCLSNVFASNKFWMQPATQISSKKLPSQIQCFAKSINILATQACATAM